mmetsp:Transcript_25564/g.33438  ORF Transcript_25564/g.33438 Transcript_25564/m.33438 type:complete len:814 (-) Transcript_25564:407-2848(-)
MDDIHNPVLQRKGPPKSHHTELSMEMEGKKQQSVSSSARSKKWSRLVMANQAEEMDKDNTKTKNTTEHLDRDIHVIQLQRKWRKKVVLKWLKDNGCKIKEAYSIKYVNEEQNNGTVLHLAAYSGNGCVVAALLYGFGMDPNNQDKCLQTPLHRACAQANLNCVKVLCGHPDIDVNARDISAWTGLHWLAYKGRSEIHDNAEEDEPDERLASADVNVVGDDERNIFTEKDSGLLKSLYAGQTWITSLTENEIRHEIAKTLLQHNIKGNIRLLWGWDVHDGSTALHMGAFYDQVSVVDALLSHHASTDILDSHGLLPIHVAALNNSPVSMKLLCKYMPSKEIVEKVLYHGLNRHKHDKKIEKYAEDPTIDASKVKNDWNGYLDRVRIGGDECRVDPVIPAAKKMSLAQFLHLCPSGVPELLNKLQRQICLEPGGLVKFIYFYQPLEVALDIDGNTFHFLEMMVLNKHKEVCSHSLVEKWVDMKWESIQVKAAMFVMVKLALAVIINYVLWSTSDYNVGQYVIMWFALVMNTILTVYHIYNCGSKQFIIQIPKWKCYTSSDSSSTTTDSDNKDSSKAAPSYWELHVPLPCAWLPSRNFNYSWNLVEVSFDFMLLLLNCLKPSSERYPGAVSTLSSLVLCVSWYRMLFYLNASSFTGPYVVAINRMGKDIVIFMILFGFVCLAYSFGQYMLLRSITADGFSNSISYHLSQAILFVLGTAEYGWSDIYALETDLHLPKVLALLYYLIYSFSVIVILLNMLIAMMGASFESLRGDKEAEFRLLKSAMLLHFFHNGLKEKKRKFGIVKIPQEKLPKKEQN